MSGSPAVTLTVTHGQPIAGDVDDIPVLVSVHVPDGEQRVPCDICCVIDISWSMSMEATVQSASGKAESDGLSMLDIAKHAVRTVLRTLNGQDRLAIVQFAREAQTVLELTPMTEEGRQKAEQVVDGIGFGGGTAVWQGLRCAFDALMKAGGQDRFQHIMLLTDGETEDKDSLMDRVRAHKAKHERLPGTINCFGFGYEIDSPLLVELASFSDGSYSFIPDAGFVGTVFVNTMSNLLVTVARDSRLTLEAESGAKIKEVMSWDSDRLPSDAVSVDLGSLQCGQSKDIVLRMSQATSEPYLAARLEFDNLSGRSAVTAEAKLAEVTKEAADAVERHRCRSLFVSTLKQVTCIAGSGDACTEMSVQAGHQLIRDLGEKIAASHAASDEKVAALLEDILGQSAEALSRLDYWKKWGRHYTPSVMLAHKLQQCNNFKDPGVQFYGGRLFDALRDEADAAFDKLPAPKITPAQYRYMGNGQVIRNPAWLAFPSPRGGVARAAQPAAPAAPVNMAAYNDRYGGCIAGSSKALLASGKLCNVSELSRGDHIAVADGTSAEISCVVRTRCHHQRALLVELPGGARVTPYHPVQVQGEWRFPIELADVKEYECDFVYSFIVQGAASLLVDGLPCISLGHGLEQGAAAHPYFASQQVVVDISAMLGYKEGLVELSPGCVVRDPVTGTVCGLRSEPQP